MYESTEIFFENRNFFTNVRGKVRKIADLKVPNSSLA